MKKSNLTIMARLAVFFVALAMAGCTALPMNLRRAVEALPDTFDRQATVLKEEALTVDALPKHSDWGFLERYSAKENWPSYTSEARLKFHKAKSIYEDTILSIYDQNEPREANVLKAALDSVNLLLDESSFLSSKARHRATFLLNAKATSADVFRQSNVDLDKALDLEHKSKLRFTSASTAHPSKAADIINRDSELSKMMLSINALFAIVGREYSRIAANEADYALFADTAIILSEKTKALAKYRKATDAKLDELDKSFVRILADQKIDYYVIIGRASWCDGEYCGNGYTRHHKPIQVSETVFERLESFTGDNLATLRRSWGKDKWSVMIDKAIWSSLQFNRRFSWTSSHEDADYWIERTEAKTFHKYTEVTNNTLVESTNWVPVSEKTYWDNQGNLGLAILTKPFGLYEEDAIADAEPVGMALVAEPVMQNGVATGSNQYGSWQNQNGTSLWVYYAQYRLFSSLLGPSRSYGYNDWNGYRSRQAGKPYYGSKDEYGTYGASTYSNPRYGNGGYAKRNPSEVSEVKRSSGSNNAGQRNKASGSGSIRGAGPANRGKGPGGSGKA